MPLGPAEMASNRQDRQPPLPEDRIPKHVGIIMDGNGRWAQARGLPRLAGHRAGTENIRRILRAAVELGIQVLTIYAFSTENWGRPRAEVQGLLRLVERVLDRELPQLHAEGVQLRHIGREERIPPTVLHKVREAIHLTRHNDRLILNVAFNYGGRAEIVDAVRSIVAAGIPVEEIDEDVVSRHTYTHDLPDPELIIRTSGEMRVSNFLVWQGVYAEYYVTPTLWPDFDADELRSALVSYADRERRMGLLPK
jgi:undecaprenyl diphosphate synthase